MRRFWPVVVAVLSVLAGSPAPPAATAANTLPTNPLGFAYRSSTGVAQYGKPTGMVVTGRCNRYAAEFATARANGAEVLAYLDPAERPDSPVCAADTGFYGGDLATTPLWPYPSYGRRVNWPGTHLTDMRAGSAWTDHVVEYVEDLMVEDEVDGVFLDVVGARLWSSLAQWDTWPAAERQAWTTGMVDLVRRLDASRRAINPRFLIINNGVWDVADAPEGRAGEPHVDGICLEHHEPTGAYHQRVAARPYGSLGQRRVLVIADDTAKARQWATVQGVTHVSDQATYGQVTPPPVGFNRLTDRPKTLGRTTVGANPSSGMTSDQKRGSKFTLTDKGTLLGFAAHLDGLGGPASGSQSVRMSLYRDDNGVPGALVAQSNTVTITAGAAARWVRFTAPATKLDPGAHWVVIHTGGTNGIARNRGDGPANWYSNKDPFADGATNPFGAGWAGSTTLSVHATYTVGH